MKIAIIGGGMSGLAAAHYLSASGHQVTVFEKEPEIGGLSRADAILPDLRWDRFYHVILTSDRELLDFLDEMGLSLNVRFTETRTGFYTAGALHSMSSAVEFLTFKPLSLWSKFRLGLGILYATRIKEFSRLEKRYAKTWLIQVFGRRNYEKLWEPLLRAKLGAASDRASAAFIWACINRYYGTRHEANKKEMMGCVDQGYHSILARVQTVLAEKGVGFRLDHEVEKVVPAENGRLTLLCANGSTDTFDRVIATIPNPLIARIVPGLPESYRARLNTVKYLGLVCVTLALKQPLSPFYVINITDDPFPFTGIIEASNIVPAEILAGRGLIYLPRYTAAGDEYAAKSDADILEIFTAALKKVFPQLGDDDIIARQVHRERWVQPIQTLAYSQNIPSFATPLDNFYIANTSMIVNSTLNNNQVIQIARGIADHIAHTAYQN